MKVRRRTSLVEVLKRPSRRRNRAAVAGITSGSVPDATTSTKGKIKLAGDLDGTADSPQIKAGVIVDADVNAAAAIAQSKISGLVSDLAGKQPLDSDLTAIAALTTTSFGRAFLEIANAGAGRTALGLVIGTDVQAYDSDLAAIAALSTTSFGRSLLTQANAGAALTTIGAAAASHTHSQSDITGLTAALALLAPLASPALTGTPTAPTPTAGDNSTKISTTAFVQALVQLTAAGFTVRPQTDYVTVAALSSYTGTGTTVLEASANGTLDSALGTLTESWPWSLTCGWVATPYAVARDSSGNLYVTAYTAAVGYHVVKFNSSGVYQTHFGSTGTGNGQFLGPCLGIAVDSSGNIYVTDTVNNRIQKFNSSGTYQAQVGAVGTGNGQFGIYGLRGLACDSSGNVFACDGGNNRVQKFNSSLTYQAQFGSFGTGNGQFDLPFGIAVDGSNNIWVTDSGNNRIQKFNSSGTYQSQFGSPGTSDSQFNLPSAIAVDSSTNLYVVDQGNGRVQKFNSSGTYQAKFGSPGANHGQFNGAAGIVVDGSGNLFVVDTNNNRVEKFMYSSGSPVAAGQTVLVKDQNYGGAHVDHGLFTVTVVGSGSTKWKLTRRTDVDATGEVMSGLMVNARRRGTKIPGGLWYISTADPITLGSTAITWEEFLPGGVPVVHGNSHAPDGNDPIPGLDTAINPPGCRVYRSTDQDINSGAWTAISYDSERHDPKNMWVSGANITIPTTGVYSLWANIKWDTNTTGSRYVYIGASTAGVIALSHVTRATSEFQVISSISKLTAGETVAVYVFQDSGTSPIKLKAGAPYQEFAVQYIGTGL